MCVCVHAWVYVCTHAFTQSPWGWLVGEGLSQWDGGEEETQLSCARSPVVTLSRCSCHFTRLCGWSKFPPPTTVHGGCTEIAWVGPELEQGPGWCLGKRVASSVCSFPLPSKHRPSLLPWPSHTRNALSSWAPRKVVRAIQQPS